MAASVHDSDEISGINITPLVDIVLVLLIIFMVSTRLVTSQSIEVDQPKPNERDAQVPLPPVMLTLDRSGQLFVDGVLLSRTAAMQQLREAKAQNRDLRALIAADGALDYASVVELIDLVRGEGITKFAIVASQPAAPRP